MITRYKVSYFHLMSAMLLLASGLLLWQWPVTQPLLQEADEAISKFLNGSVSEENAWSFFWAMLNHDNERWANVIVMMSIHAMIVRLSPQKYKPLMLWLVVFYWLILQLSILLQHTIYRQMIDSYRNSPYYYFSEVTSLAKLYNNSGIKEHDLSSFPSWHAFAGCFWMMYTLHIMPRNMEIIKIVVCLIATCLIFSRPIGGSQWPSDAIYSCISAYLVWSFCFCTNFLSYYLPASFNKL